MILSIQLPKGSHVIVDQDKVFIVFDGNVQEDTSFKRRMLMWLVDADTLGDFWGTTTLACYEMIVTLDSKLKALLRK